jgi:ribosomal protein S18 acetylase RimI-like enzyme
MRPLAEAGGVRYGLVDGPDVPAMVRVLADAFSKHDPPAIALGLSAADIERIVQILAEKALDEDVTVVAVTDAGELVGAMLTEDFGTPPPDLSVAPPGFAALGEVLDQLEDEYRGMYTVSPGTDLHLFMLGVSDAFAGRGVAQKMVELCVENGARRRYRRAFAETTGRTSQHIFRKAGFQERSRVSYGDFSYEERRVFASIAGEGGTLLMVRSLA